MLREELNPAPGEMCFGCFGRGFHVPRGHNARACLVCHGESTAGVFAVQVLDAQARYEINGETTDFRRAVRTAIRAATLASLRVKRAVPTEARAVYYPADGTAPRVIYRVPVMVPEGETVAA